MTDLDPPPESSSPELLVEMSRLKNLSGGVFVIALTLLVLDLRIPKGVLAGELAIKLLDLAPKVLVYLISCCRLLNPQNGPSNNCIVLAECHRLLNIDVGYVLFGSL